MNRGPIIVKIVPHHSVAVTIQGFSDDEKMLKHKSRRKGCIGT